MKIINRDIATQFPAMIVVTVDGSSEVPDLIVFMRDDAREDSVYDGLLAEADLMRRTLDEALR